MAINVEEYITQLPEDRQEPMQKLRNTILQNIDKNFQENISYGMIGYVVPHSIYPSGYHCNPNQPLPFLSIASQKNFIALYHMGIYADKELLEWFTTEYKKQVGKKPDMGKSCIRFKKPEQIPYDLIRDLIKKMDVTAWIEIYERNIKS